MHTLNREPLFEDASAEASAKATCAAGDTDPQASTRRSFRVLVVEDETDSRELIKIALTDKDYDLVFLDNGTAALEECKRQLPDIAILDFQLPGHSGLEICRYIKENSGRRFIPTLILTSQTELCDKVAGLNHGADEYIAKPFQLPELEAQVRALLRIKALTDELEQTRSKLEDKERQLVAAQVAGAAAHELGQPLTSLMINCEMFKHLAATAEQEKLLLAILHECNRMKAILASLTTLADPTRGDFRVSAYPGGLTIVDLRDRTVIK